MNPKIDVVIPVFNGELYLEYTVKSIINQSYKPQAIIIVDDGSTDKTERMCNKLKSHHSQIKYIRQTNAGLSAARNSGIRQSKTEYIAFCDSDDIWEKEKLAKQVQLIKSSKFSQLGLIYCDYYNIDEQGKHITYQSMNLHKDIRGYVLNKLMEGNYIASSGSGVLVKRECFVEVGMFDEKLTSCEDWDMWIRIAHTYQVDYVNEKLVGIRRSVRSMSKDGVRMCIGMAMLYRKHGNLTKSRVGRNYFFHVLAKQVMCEYPQVTITDKVRKIIGDEKDFGRVKLTLLLMNAIADEYLKSRLNTIIKRIK